MKIKFCIHYATEWGQMLHVDATYFTEDGRKRHYLLPMNTEDGETWVLETSVMESRQHRVNAISYFYLVMDGEGKLLRREWTKVPRLYAFDGTLDYFFPDQWRDVPVQSHLYTEAFLVTTSHLRHNPSAICRLPLFRRTVVLRVSAPQLRKGESLGVCGNHPAIGSWSPSRYLPMTAVGDGDWMLAVNVEGLPLPLEYKYVVVDKKTKQLKAWEEGDNRVSPETPITDGQVLVLHGGLLRMREPDWRVAGVALPLTALRTDESCGAGDFGDLKTMVDWAVASGMKMVQLLPVLDTTTMHSSTDAHPYNVISAFALHPHYLDLGALPPLKDEERRTAFNRQRRELNALQYTDYMAVGRVKSAYAEAVFEESGKETLESEDFRAFLHDNEVWLLPYAAFCILRDKFGTARFTDWPQLAVYDETQVRTLLEQEQAARDFIYFIQYHLHRQLRQVADYAHQNGIALMGDLPIGIYRDSVETWTHPEYFLFEAQVGTPPDQESMHGQNWGFPPYRWYDPSAHDTHGIYAWMRSRLAHMEQFFDALRIDHFIGYFRIWQIPDHAVLANMGHFSPALPLSEEEITRTGLVFRRELHTRPFINDRILNRIFGIHANYVKDNFLTQQPYGLYALREEYDTQVKVRNHFGGLTDENSLWIRDGLYRLIANVLFLEDQQMPEMYHPRFMVYQEPVYEILGAEEKDAFMRLYNNYFYERHNDFWAAGADHLLAEILADTRMLIVAEDLGMLPECVGRVIDAHRILSTEIQTMPKQPGIEFSHLQVNPYRSLCTISTHDMSPLRLWWEENIGRAQRYYATVLQRQGKAPYQLPPHIAEQIVARQMYSPSMLCVLAIQDWLAMDATLRGKNVAEERVNSPYDSYNVWKYRMGPTVRQLIESTQFNHKLKTMIHHSKR